MDTNIAAVKKQIRVFLSLGGLFFFGPYVQYYLKHTTLDIDKQDRQFILSYSKLGYIAITLAIAVILFGAYNFIMTSVFAEFVYTLSMYVLVAMLLIGSVFVFSNTQLLKGTETSILTLTKVEESQGELVKSFIPGYNFHAWYSIHKFTEPLWVLKESLLWTILFVFIQIAFHSVWLSLSLVLCMVVRLISLMSGYDILPKNRKDTINQSFLVNIEELWGNVLGSFRYIRDHYALRHNGKKVSEYMKEYRVSYTKLYSFNQNPTLILEYGLLIIVVALYVWQLSMRPLFGLTLGLETVALLLFFARYLIMFPYKQFPLVPLFHEIAVFIMKFIKPQA